MLRYCGCVHGSSSSKFDSVRSVHAKGRVACLQKSRLADGLEKALYRTQCEHPRADGFSFICCDKNDRDLLPPKHQFSLKVRTGHTRHCNVEDEALSCTDAVGREKLL